MSALQRLYVDVNATCVPSQAARDAAAVLLDWPLNSSSVHAEGRVAKRYVEDARRFVADLVHVSPSCVVFTSGGTEANALALQPTWREDGDDRPLTRLFISSVEHASVLSGGEFSTDCVHVLPVLSSGKLDIAALQSQLLTVPSGERALVSVMAANNETGVVQPLQDIEHVVRAHGALWHTDAVQWVGRVGWPFGLDCSLQGGVLRGPDLITVSAHKFGGLLGAGALVVANPKLHCPHPLLRGGGQERGLRAGTLNVPAIAAFGAASREALSHDWEPLRELRDAWESQLLQLDTRVVVAGLGTDRLPNTSCVMLPGVSAETLLMHFDLAGIAVSSGSACSSGKVAASHVLQAMGFEDSAVRSAVRVSFGPWHTHADVSRLLELWKTRILSLETYVKSPISDAVPSIKVG